MNDKSKDPVSPAHYQQGKISPADYIADQRMGFFEGNVVKYVTRHRKKNGIEDLKKAHWYLTYLIENYSELFDS